MSKDASCIAGVAVSNSEANAVNVFEFNAFDFQCKFPFAGTFDLTIDGTTHTNIDVHIEQRDFLELINRNGDYTMAEKKGTCYGMRIEHNYEGRSGIKHPLPMARGKVEK